MHDYYMRTLELIPFYLKETTKGDSDVKQVHLH